MSEFKFLDKVGGEIEGGWYNPRKDLIVDAGIRKEEFSDDCASVGELVTKPYSSLSEYFIFSFIKENWPDETNPMSGYHVHFSFKNLKYYSECMTKKFYDAFLIKMKEWGDKYPCRNIFFWERLDGKNRFCIKAFNPKIQLKINHKGVSERYTHLNFCYKMHKTIECRLFPTFHSADTAISSTNYLINFIEEYLFNCSNLNKSEKSKIEISSELGRQIDNQFVPISFDDSRKMKINLFNLYTVKR